MEEAALEISKQHIGYLTRATEILQQSQDGENAIEQIYVEANEQNPLDQQVCLLLKHFESLVRKEDNRETYPESMAKVERQYSFGEIREQAVRTEEIRLKKLIFLLIPCIFVTLVILIS